MMDDQNDKQRSCFWWFMEVGESGGMRQRDSLARRNTALRRAMDGSGADDAPLTFSQL
jgi:hypothetical protein